VAKTLAELTYNRGRMANTPLADLSNSMTPIISEFFKRVDASMVPPRTKAVFDRIGGVVKVTADPFFKTSRSEYDVLGDQS
jgi:hypothetical protein